MIGKDTGELEANLLLGAGPSPMLEQVSLAL